MSYKLAGSALGIAYWEMDALDGNALSPDGRFSWSPELFHMLGFTDGAGAEFDGTFSSWVARFHPGDADKVLSALSAHAADATGKTPFITEFRLKRKNGEYICVSAFGSAMRNEAGVPVRIIGALKDITEEKRPAKNSSGVKKRSTYLTAPPSRCSPGKKKPSRAR